MAKITLFAQIIQQLKKINQISNLKAWNEQIYKVYNTWSQLGSMIFCKLTNCVYSYKISNDFHSAKNKMIHLSIVREHPCKKSIIGQMPHLSITRIIYVNI